MAEPRWGYDFLHTLVNLGEKYNWIARFYPIGADIFVFIYPIFLVMWYLHGVIKKNWQRKQEALFIFF